MFVKSIAAICAAGTMLAAQPASAAQNQDEAARAAQRSDRKAERERRRAERSERFYVSLWMVAESDSPLGPRTVADSEYVLRNRLLPPRLIRLTADAAEEGTGRVVVPAGTQLFGLSTSGAPIWCVVGRRDPGTAERILLGGGSNRQICLTDLDRDGDVDAHFSVVNQVRGVPNFSGYRPLTPDPLTGAAYETLRPDQIEIEYFVGIRFEGRAILGARPVFSVSYGSERSRGSLTSGVRARRDGSVETMGAAFQVTGAADGRLQVDVTRNIPAQPFHVMRTVTYSFY